MNKQTIERFVAHASATMPRLLARTHLYDVEMYDDEAMLEFRLPEPLDVEELLDLMDDEAELILLYHVIPTAATLLGQRCAAYVNPITGYMYKINAVTDDNGAVDTLFVTLYDSLTTMGMDVLDELERMTGRYSARFARRKVDVLHDFMR